MNNPLLSIVVVNYLERNQKHLDLCLDTIFKQDLPIEYEIILVSSGEYKPTHVKSERIKHIHSDERMHYPLGVNTGVKNSNPNSKYLFICNDDLLMTKNSIMNMIDVIGDNDIILNPLSTCDNHFRYVMPLGFMKDEKPMMLNNRFYKFEELENDFNDIFNNSFNLPKSIVFIPYCCLYATMMPRKVWDKVGGLDPNFETGIDDLDFGWRAHLMGIRSAVALNAFILHFGGSTANHSLNDNNRNHNEAYFLKKWRSHPGIFQHL